MTVERLPRHDGVESNGQEAARGFLFREQLLAFDHQLKTALGDDGSDESLQRLFPEALFHEVPEDVDPDFDVSAWHGDLRTRVASVFSETEYRVPRRVSEIGVVDWAVDSVQRLVTLRGMDQLSRIVQRVGDAGVIVRGQIPDASGTTYRSQPNTYGFRRLFSEAIGEMYPESKVLEQDVPQEVVYSA